MPEFKNAKNVEYFRRFHQLLDDHTQIMLVEVDNVGSKQLAEIRYALRGRATLLMGRNTKIRTALKHKIPQMPQLANLLTLIEKNVGLMFCKCDATEVRKVILEHRVPAPAKQGAIAPCDVFVPAGPTGMDPGQTAFFQALQIATKIVKGQIEIQSDVHIIKEGDRVSASQSVLLTKLNIKPFSYGLKATMVYDNGSTFPASVLAIEPSAVVEKFRSAIQHVAALSLATSIPTKPSVAHSIVAAYRQVCGVALDVDFDFPQLAALREAMKNPQAFAPAPAAAAPAAAVQAEAPQEEEESEDDDMGFGLFD